MNAAFSSSMFPASAFGLGCALPSALARMGSCGVPRRQLVTAVPPRSASEPQPLAPASAIALLEQAIARHRQTATKRELVEQAEEFLRIALRDIMELSDETFLESRDFLREGDRGMGHTWTDVETFRRHRAEIARLTLALNAE